MHVDGGYVSHVQKMLQCLHFGENWGRGSIPVWIVDGEVGSVLTNTDAGYFAYTYTQHSWDCSVATA